MRYADQHMHCTASFDAEGELPDMIAAAEAAGLRAVCFTDHVDMAEEHTGQTAPTWPGLREKYAARREQHALMADGGGVEVRFGIELGEPCQAPDVAESAAGEEGLDLVIASLHNLPDTPDFHHIPYGSEEECEAINHRYLAELLRTVRWGKFDVLGHIGYTARYMSARGFTEKLTVEKYGDELEELFNELIDRGIGIECNTSGFRSGGTFPYPDRDVLTLYRELGGEIITVGSDAHVPGQVGMHFPEVYELLYSCGFMYVAEFRGRNPIFYTLT